VKLFNDNKRVLLLHKYRTHEMFMVRFGSPFSGPALSVYS